MADRYKIRDFTKTMIKPGDIVDMTWMYLSRMRDEPYRYRLRPEPVTHRIRVDNVEPSYLRVYSYTRGATMTIRRRDYISCVPVNVIAASEAGINEFTLD